MAAGGIFNRVFSMRTPRVLVALLLREMGTTYGRSAGGYLWAIAEPVAGIVLLTAVFSFIVRTPPLGNSFALYYATGIVPFMMYMSVSSKVAQAILFSKPLLVYPRVTFFDAVLARFILNGLTQLVVAYLVFTTLLFFGDTRAVLNFSAIGSAFAMVLALSFGIGTMNCLLFEFFPSWKHLWAILNRPMFLISGIFFGLENVPDGIAEFLWYNPLIHVTTQMRVGFYSSYDPTYVSPTYVFMFALVPSLVGLFFLRRYHKKILNEL